MNAIRLCDSILKRILFLSWSVPHHDYGVVHCWEPIEAQDLEEPCYSGLVRMAVRIIAILHTCCKNFGCFFFYRPHIELLFPLSKRVIGASPQPLQSGNCFLPITGEPCTSLRCHPYAGTIIALKPHSPPPTYSTDNLITKQLFPIVQFISVYPTALVPFFLSLCKKLRGPVPRGYLKINFCFICGPFAYLLFRCRSPSLVKLESIKKNFNKRIYYKIIVVQLALKFYWEKNNNGFKL